MKEQIIQLPYTLEIKEIKDNKIILVEKEKKLTYDYDYVANKLFPDGKIHFYIDNGGCINTSVSRTCNYTCTNNVTSKRQAEKLLAINMLMNVAKYLNNGWQPNWNNYTEYKYSIYYSHKYDKLSIHDVYTAQSQSIYFKTKELAQQAIEILGEETIKLALCTDY